MQDSSSIKSYVEIKDLNTFIDAITEFNKDSATFMDAITEFNKDSATFIDAITELKKDSNTFMDATVEFKKDSNTFIVSIEKFDDKKVAPKPKSKEKKVLPIVESLPMPNFPSEIEKGLWNLIENGKNIQKKLVRVHPKEPYYIQILIVQGKKTLTKFFGNGCNGKYDNRDHIFKTNKISHDSLQKIGIVAKEIPYENPITQFNYASLVADPPENGRYNWYRTYEFQGDRNSLFGQYLLYQFLSLKKS